LHPEGALLVLGFGLFFFGSAANSPPIALVGGCIVLVGLVAVVGAFRMARGRWVRPGISVGDGLTGTDFELFLVDLFRRMGYSVDHVGGPGDLGADLVLTAGGQRTVVQAKCWQGIVGHEAVQQAVAAKNVYGASVAMLVTNSAFTPHAQQLARLNNVDLWDRSRLTIEMARLGDIPTPTGAALLGEQLRAALPSMLRIVALFFSAMLALAASTGGGRRGRPGKRRRR
jgi:restriction system protein